jgi:DNA repair ATPase RecN
VYNKYIQNYEPKTSNQEIKDLIDDLKLEQKRRLEDASELKDQSTEMLKYMKANDTFQWNQGMSYINDEDKKYSDQEDKYFDVKHKLEKVYNHLKDNYDQNKRKLKETESKLIFK